MFRYSLSHKKKGGGVSLSVVTPRIFSTLSGSQSSVAHPQTLLNIAVLVAQHGVSLWHGRVPSHSSVLIGSQYVEEHLSSREDRKNRHPPTPNQHSPHPIESPPSELPAENCGYVDRETARSMMDLSPSVMGHLRSLPFNHSYRLELLVVY